jgi:hypothetical protein
LSSISPNHRSSTSKVMRCVGIAGTSGSSVSKLGPDTVDTGVARTAEIESSVSSCRLSGRLTQKASATAPSATACESATESADALGAWFPAVLPRAPAMSATAATLATVRRFMRSSPLLSVVARFGYRSGAVQRHAVVSP